MSTLVYYDAAKTQVTFSKRTREDLGVCIGSVDGPVVNPNFLVTGLLKQKGIVPRGLIIISTPLE